MNALGSKKNRRNSGRHADKKIDVSQNTSFLSFFSFSKYFISNPCSAVHILGKALSLWTSSAFSFAKCNS